MLKKFVIQLIFLLIVSFIALALATGKITTLPFTTQPNQISDLTVGANKLTIEVADTKEKRSKGLGDRQSLASNSGMLFVFDSPAQVPFWMKGLKFPLDFIWIKDSKVVDLIKNAQPPQVGQKDQDLPFYLPNQTINQALEVNTGYIDSHNVKVGDEVKILK